MRKGKVIGLLFVFMMIGYFVFPKLIHFLYANATDESEISNNLSRYNIISLELNGLSNQEKPKDSMAILDSLYLWLHVRGISVDEGHNSIGINEQWREIIEYHYY